MFRDFEKSGKGSVICNEFTRPKNIIFVGGAVHATFYEFSYIFFDIPMKDYNIEYRDNDYRR